MESAALEPSTAPFGDALRAAMRARDLSFRDVETRSLIPVGRVHDLAAGRRGAPGDGPTARLAEAVGVHPSYFREWRERRILDALRADPDAALTLWRAVEHFGLRDALGLDDAHRGRD